jgi:GxxExxY protein
MAGMARLTADRLNRLSEIIIGCAIRIHRVLGPGLLESVYVACLVFELNAQKINVEIERPIPVEYRGVRIPCGFKADLIVEGALIVEVKSVERLAPIHQAKMITYLRLADCPLGLILNFNNMVMKDGVKRVVNNFPE